MRKDPIAIPSGDRYRGSLPAAPTATIQSHDALEVGPRTLSEDALVTSFVVKALSLFLTLVGIINRFRAAIAQLDQMFADALEFAELQPDDVNLNHAYSHHSNIRGLFCNNLNILHQYQLQQNDRLFRLWLKQVISETPSLTATLHGASCGNLLCTYQI